MTEEPYRWVEAIANRREYIENQLAAGSPIAALSCADGVLFVTVSRHQQKLFEIYDRIAMGGIGHPGDIERLRMSAIEVASAEGFSRSANDVSLRRMAAYSLSPVLKNAFEQIYGPPFLARMLFAELGRNGEPDLLLRLDYDGSFHTNSGTAAPERFATISGKEHSSKMMTQFLSGKKYAHLTSAEALPLALDSWAVGHLTLARDEGEIPSQEEIAAHRQEQLRAGTLEAVLLDRRSPAHATFRTLKM
ncbi:MAG: 20S proteasome subunit A/B [Verrucomicrobia bacterium]|nr:20S proteasome subunit A/B [Verrucomicrobiota bacterium]